MKFSPQEAAELERQALANGGSVRATPVRVPGEQQRPRQASEIDPTAPSLFLPSCEHYGLPRPVPEYKFDPSRKWRFDYAWPKRTKQGHFVVGGVALEIEGGVWTKGRHTRGKGFIKDMEKYNAAALAGWKLLRCTPQDVEDESIFKLLKRALAP